MGYSILKSRANLPQDMCATRSFFEIFASCVEHIVRNRTSGVGGVPFDPACRDVFHSATLQFRVGEYIIHGAERSIRAKLSIVT
jgi:hypothetical protein